MSIGAASHIFPVIQAAKRHIDGRFNVGGRIVCAETARSAKLVIISIFTEARGVNADTRLSDRPVWKLSESVNWR